MDANRVQRILSQSDHLWRHQYQEGASMRRVWAKLKPVNVIELLDECAHAAKPVASELLRLMETRLWQLAASAPEGAADQARASDNSLHLTLKVGSSSYQLRCKEAPALQIVQITR
jgi:hypothetical protein